MLTPEYRPAQAAFNAHGDPALAGLTVAVVGATGGLGTAVSRALALNGVSVVLLGRKLKRLEQLYDVIEPLGDAVPAMAELDLATTGTDEARAVAEMLFAEFGKLDALVLAAVDGGTPTPQASVTDSEFERVMRVNVAGPRALMVGLLPLLQRAEHPSVVTLLDGRPQQHAGAYTGAYGISKLALHALMLQCAAETDHLRGDDGAPQLAINGYDPGPMRTPLRRRFFAGEHARQAPPPEERLGPLLHLIARSDRSLNGAALRWVPEDAA